MFNTSVLRTVLILLSATRIIFSIPVLDEDSDELISKIAHTSSVPEDFTTESQNVLVCEAANQCVECEEFLEKHVNKDSKEYGQLQDLKDITRRVRAYSVCVPVPKFASISGYTELIKVLLLNGVQVNKKYAPCEETMLHIASECGNNNLVTELLSHGADTQVKDKFGNTPIHTAASHFKSTTVKILLDAGAHVNVINNVGETPLFQTIDYLCPSMPEYKNVIGKDIIKLLLEHGADTNIANHLRKTPLHVAAKNSNLTIVKLLIDGGANINATDVNNQTPLHKATESNNMPVVEYLVTRGIDKTITDLDKKTALDLAKEKGFTKIFDLLSRQC